MSCAGSVSCSWKTDHSQQSSFDVTKKTPKVRKVNAQSAKISGMKFPSWREPKIIRASPATSPVDGAETPMKNFPIIRRSLDVRGEQDVKDIVDRLSSPTVSSRMKLIKAHPNTVLLNMNHYSWSNMAAYKDFQKTIYTNNGTMKKSYKKCSRR